MAAMIAVLPLGGLERAGLLTRSVARALETAGIGDLAELAAWSRRRLAVAAELTEAELDVLEALLARYCLAFAPERRKRFRRPRHQLDPY